jgi:S1-C subfamily serine protease
VNDKRRLGIRNGIRVAEILGGRFQKAGIPEGFIIVKINNVYIDAVNRFEDLAGQFNIGDGILIQGYETNGQANYYAFEW